jgi:NAD(P)H-dependent FMN reductase
MAYDTTPRAARLLAVSGSLSDRCVCSRTIAALRMVAPPGVDLAIYEGLGDLPHFNPDLDGAQAPAPVVDLRRRITACDGLVICSPSLAHGVAGALKNALDWLAGSGELTGVPVAVINATARAEIAYEHLCETLTVMAAWLIEGPAIDVRRGPRPAGRRDRLRPGAGAEAGGGPGRRRLLSAGLA